MRRPWTTGAKTKTKGCCTKKKKMSDIRSWELWDITGLYKHELKAGNLKE